MFSVCMDLLKCCCVCVHGYLHGVCVLIHLSMYVCVCGVCMSMYVYIYNVYVCGAYICTRCIPIRVYNCICVSSCVWMRVAALRTRSCDPNR